MNFVAVQMLLGDRAKYLGLIFAVAFSTFLMSHQSSIFAGIMRRTTSQIMDVPDASIWVMDRKTQYFDEVKALTDDDLYRVRGVSFTLNRRMSNELEFSASYTLSKTIDDASDFNEQAQNPFDLSAERARSLQDQRHRLVFNALWELPIGDVEAGKPPQNDSITKVFGHIEVAPILTLGSGRPLNPLTGIDSNGNGAYALSSRPLGLGRNSFQTPMPVNVDLRVLRYFPIGNGRKLDLVAEAFNLLNHPNVAQLNPVFGQGSVALPSFPQPLTGVGARRLQFSLDFEF